MQAQGNDFVILDGLQDVLPSLNEALIRRICHRQQGIGCDQLLVLQKHNQADALMLIYNADGTQAKNCGNGLRCVAQLLMKKVGKDSLSIALADRTVYAERTSKGIRVNMGQGVISQECSAHTDVNIGNLHRVYFEAGEIDSSLNTEFISAIDDNHVHIRIVERGSGETLACGSGACAVAIAVWNKFGTEQPLEIHMPGGVVTVSQHNQDVFLEGSVSVVFQGDFFDI